MLATVLAFVLLAATGLFGQRDRRVSASAAGYELTVTFPAMSRGGLATQWSAVVRRSGGFEGPVMVATTSDYFTIFDENAIHPQPASVTTSGDMLVWEFDPPTGDALTIDIDARLEPDVHLGRGATTSVLVDDAPVVEVTYTTRVMP